MLNLYHTCFLMLFLSDKILSKKKKLWQPYTGSQLSLNPLCHLCKIHHLLPLTSPQISAMLVKLLHTKNHVGWHNKRITRHKQAKIKFQWQGAQKRKTNFFYIDIRLEWSFKKTTDHEYKQYSVQICVHTYNQDLTIFLCTVCMCKAHL